MMNKNEKFWNDAWAGKAKPKSNNKFVMKPQLHKNRGIFEEMWKEYSIEHLSNISTIMDDIAQRLAKDAMNNIEKIIKELLIKKGYDEINKVYLKKEKGNDWTYYFADEEGTMFICQIKEKFYISDSFEETKANMDLVYHNGPFPTNHLNF